MLTPKGDVMLTEFTPILLVFAILWHFVAAAAALSGAMMPAESCSPISCLGSF